MHLLLRCEKLQIGQRREHNGFMICNAESELDGATHKKHTLYCTTH